MKIIFNGDNHTQVSVPACRADDFEATQIRKLKFIKDTADKYKALILNSGDITHTATGKTAYETQQVNNFLLQNFPEETGIIGNHDAKYHRLDYIMDSLVSCLISAGRYHLLTEPTEIGTGVVVYPFNFGFKIQHNKVDKTKVNIALYHDYVSQNKDPNIEGDVALSLLKSFPEYDFILTGDNHETFVMEYEGRILINPGSIFRTTTKQKDFEPSIFLIDTDTKEWEQIKIPIELGIIVNEAAEEKKESVARWEAFINSINTKRNPDDPSIDFKTAVELELVEINASEAIILLCRKAMDIL